MPVTLLPASAAAHAPRASPNIVLGKKPEAWLTQTLKRANRVKRPLNSVAQHHKCLTEILSLPTAIWTLCSLLLPKAPEVDLRKDENPLVEALVNYQWLHIEAYVVHVDMVSQGEVAFKLTSDTIESLIDYHKDIFSVNENAAHHNWNEKEVQLKKLHEDFISAINKFVFRTTANALEGLEEDGGGELLVGGAEEVKSKILGMFLPLMPPPPPAPQAVQPAPILPSSNSPDTWWPSSITSHQQQQQHHHLQQQQPQPQQSPQDQWRGLSSSPSPSSSAPSYPSSWTPMGLREAQTASPTLTPEYSPPYSPEEAFTPDWSTQAEYFHASPATCEPYSLPLQYPSMLSGQCGSSSVLESYGGMDNFATGLGNFGFGYADFIPSMAYATTM